MTHTDFSDDTLSIREEACLWVVRIDGGEMSSDQVDELREWMSRSPKHRAELKSLSSEWDTIDELLRTEVLSTGAVPEAANNNGIWASVKMAGAVAATVLVMMMTTQYWIADDELAAPEFYSSVVGEQKTVTLADGSEVILNTGSQIEVLYSENARNIRLVRGEALFDVAKNKERPFVVYAGTGAVRAVGTAFAVQLHHENVEVTVTEGLVELSSYTAPKASLVDELLEGDSPQALANLAAGQTAKFSNVIETLETVEQDKIDQKLSWRSGILMLDGTTLEDVVKDVGRYTPLEFIIADAKIRDLRISGYFKTGETDVLLNTLESSFNIKVERTDNGIVYLSSAVN